MLLPLEVCWSRTLVIDALHRGLSQDQHCPNQFARMPHVQLTPLRAHASTRRLPVLKQRHSARRAARRARRVGRQAPLPLAGQRARLAALGGTARELKSSAEDSLRAPTTASIEAADMSYLPLVVLNSSPVPCPQRIRWPVYSSHVHSTHPLACIVVLKLLMLLSWM